MSWHMVTDADVRRLPVPEKLLMFADSYLDAAIALCTQVATDHAKCTWSSGSVVLMLSAHATELFLKAALLKRAPEEAVWVRAHDIVGLSTDYRRYFPEAEFEWEIPFRTEQPERLSEAEIASLASMRDAPPSILYRYPVQKGGADWNGLHAFEPNSFLTVLDQLRHDFQRIRALLV